MNFPQLQIFGGGGNDGQSNDASNAQPDGGLMAQNNDFMRQMQQQLAAQGGMPQQQGAAGGFGQFQNINANVLMSAFQQAAPPGQNPLQGAESLLASVLAAANSNSQNQGVAQNSQQPVSHPAPTAPAPSPFAGLQGLEQLQNFNPGVLPQGFQPSLNGLQGLQQQLMSLQQQLGGGVGQQQQGQQQQPQSGQTDQQAGQQHLQFSQQAQFPSWMGQGFNPAAFNPAALSLGALGGGDPNSFQNQDAFSQGGAMANLGMNPAFQFQQQQFQQIPQQQPVVAQNKQSRRTSSLSNGSGIGKDEAPPSGRGASGKGANKKAAPDKKKRAKSFPEKLMQAMMDNADEEAVAWLPDGKSFVIVNPDLFCNDVLNKIFKESKYASFVRKLHRWGFVRLTSGTGTDCFHHPQFQRNKREMASKISCAPRGDKDKEIKSNSKPPSLAGVEKFIRAKVVAAAASAAATAEESLLLKEEDDLSGDEDDEGADMV